MKETAFICTCCNEEYPISQCYEVSGDPVCPNCLERETVVCTSCGERILRDVNAGNSDTPLCQYCYDRHYTECDRCGALIRQSNACYWSGDEPFCCDCYTQMEKERGIHDYYYKPTPIFYGGGPRFFGVELEIDGAGESDRNAGELLQIANAQEHYRLYCKHDGSLDDGFELVTHPMTLEYHEKRMPWSEILARAVEMGYTSHQAGSCGLHIHVCRLAFGETEQVQDVAIARVLYFFEKHWEELLNFSRRTPRQLKQWAARYGYQEQPRDILEHAKKGYHGGRYTCVNLQPEDTIEFRIFRGTLKYNTLIATLQLVNRICDVAIYLSDEELKALSWPTFAAGCTQPELVQYLKERRLYVNEPVEVEVEI